MSRLPALLPLLAALAGGFFGLTMSLDGGLEEVEESLRAAANCCCNWVIRASPVPVGLSSRDLRVLLGNTSGKAFAIRTLLPAVS